MAFRLNETLELGLIKWVSTALSEVTLSYNSATVTVRQAYTGATYTSTINGTAYSYVALVTDTIAGIATALIAVINAGSEPINITDNLDGSYFIESTNADTFSLKTDFRQMSFLAIWDKQDSQFDYPVKPPLPYATLNILSLIDHKSKYYQRKSQGIYTLISQKGLVLSINIFSNSNHMGLMQTLQTSLERQPILDILASYDVAYRDSTNPVDISALLEQKHELRSQMDVTFAYSTSIDDELGEIESVTYTPTYGGETKNLETIP